MILASFLMAEVETLHGEATMLRFLYQQIIAQGKSELIRDG